MNKLKETLKLFEKSVNYLIDNKIDTQKKTLSSKAIYDYKELKKNSFITTYLNLYSRLQQSLLDLINSNDLDYIEADKLKDTMKSMEISFQKDDFNGLKNQLKAIGQIEIPIKKYLSFNQKNIPINILPEIKADFEELNKCYFNSCFRSSIILCGRLLETALHSKYFEETGFDLLDKNPGMGLGNLIAKLKEKNINLPPGITEQIHLINNVRTFSVHKKKEAFYPSKQQANAIILFTIDVLEKLFL